MSYILVVSGTRKTHRNKEVRDFLASLDKPLYVLQGGASGVDAAVRVYCDKHDWTCITVQANWVHSGASAGHKRNKKMLELAEFLSRALDPDSSVDPSYIRRVAFPDKDHSPGTMNFIKTAKEMGLEAEVL